MRALWRNENGTLAFETIHEPQIVHSEDVKIQIMYNVIGIQDLRMSREWDFYAKPGIAGYEMSGKIVDLGFKAKEAGFYIGQRVSGTVVEFCNNCSPCLNHEEHNCQDLTTHSGTLCNYIVWNYRQLIPLEDGVPYSIGALIEPVAVVYMAALKMQIRPGDSVCIFGGDFNGLVLIQIAKLLGAAKVIVVEPKPNNRKLAELLGADHVIDSTDDTYTSQLMKLSDFVGFRSIAITSSNTAWLKVAPNLAARGSSIVFTVYYDLGKDISVNSIKFFAMNLNLCSSFLYSREVLLETQSILRKLKLQPLIAEEYPLKNAIEAFNVEAKYLYPRVGIKHW